ncbi:MAG: TolC family protein [Sediminibacterium sp.]
MAGLKNKWACLIIGLIACLSAPAQAPVPGGEILSLPNVLEWVRKYHPVARQAVLITERADAELTAARGAFDPVVGYDVNRKTFDGQNYYNYSNGELQVPFAAPVTLRTGLENTRGLFANPELSIGRMSYFGIEVPLANGLLIDKRRAALQQAKLMKTMSVQDRLAQVNDLLLETYAAYWRWAGAWEINQLITQFSINAANRLQLVRINWQNGDRSVMDTVEAYAQLQQIKLLQSEAAMKLNNMALELSYFLWQADDQPVRLADNLQPEIALFRGRAINAPLEELLATALDDNPMLNAAALKVSSMEIDKKLKFQQLLPYFSVKANVLNNNYSVFSGWESGFLQNNNRWGVGFSMPLFFRQGRGEYKRAQIKLKESTIELSAKRWQTENKIRYYYTEFTRQWEQLQLTDQVQTNLRQLLKNEELRFSQGESSLFLVNSREIKWLESLQKQTELRVKYLISAYQVQWAAGTLR